MTDEIESPAHYNFGQMEAREIIELAIADFRDPTTVYHVASALKYLLRASRKNGADDIAKARKHVGWAEDAARAHEKRLAQYKLDKAARLSAGDAAGVAYRHGDIAQVCGLDRDPHEILEEISGIRDAGEFTQPPNCALGVSESRTDWSGFLHEAPSKHPMHAVALEMAESATPKRRGESPWGVSARKTGESAWEITLPLVTTKSDAAAYARQELIEGIARMNAMAEGHAYPKLAEPQTEYQTLVEN